jgi:hypothetical protein
VVKCALDVGHSSRVRSGEPKFAESNGRGGEATDSALMHGRMVTRETPARWPTIMARMRKVLALVLLVACGDDEFTGLPDGPQGPDGTPDTPTEGLVKLTVTDAGLPRMGVKVYFQNADSSLVSATMTDVNGVASAVMEAGGFVTAIQPFAQQLPTGVASTELKTFAGVKPLDELVLSRDDLPPAVVNATVLANPDPAVVNGGNYTLYSPCQSNGLSIGSTGSGSGSGSGSISSGVTFIGCGATTDLTVVVTDFGGVVQSSIHKPNVTLTEKGIIDLTDLTYVAAETATWEFTNVPAFIGSFNVTDALATTSGPQFVTFDGAAIDNATGITLPHPRPVIDNSAQIVLANFSGAPVSTHGVLEWGPPTTAYSKSLTDVLLASYATLPEYSLANKSVTWTVDPGPAPDFAIIRTDLFRKTAPLLDWDWEIAAPVGTELTVRYPVLPAPDDQFNPITNDSTTVNRLTTAKLAGGYDAIREVVLSLDGDPNTGLPLDLVVGATGRVVTEDLPNLRAKRTPGTLLPLADKIGKALKAHRR